MIQRVRPAPNQTNPGVTVTTGYGYDSLNRLTAIDYSDVTTPDVQQLYDQAYVYGSLGVSNPVGHLTQSQVVEQNPPPGQYPIISANAPLCYDTVGRMNNNSLCTPRTCGWGGDSMLFGYDLMGDMTWAGNGVSAATITTPYDAAGNLLANAGMSYSWNAEGETKSAGNVTYLYDGDGRRVKKSTGKLYWYGMSSEPLVETDGAGNNPVEYVFFDGKRIARRDSSGKVDYYLADHLGSSRVVTDSAGNILDDCDFLPFGGTTCVAGSTSGNTYEFTGKERDSESGNDYFGARYYTNILGRFMSPDPLGGSLVDPQTLNKYSYVRNNPINLTDPTGMYECADDQNKCQTKQDLAFEAARQNDLKSKDPGVVRGASAYGDPTKDNGVNVGFADLSKNGEGGVTTSTLGTDANGNLRANSNVVIGSNVTNTGGSALDANVGPEGSHVADAQDLVNSITITDLAKGTFTVGQDVTQYPSEQQAYHVTDSILRSENTHETFQCGVGTCQLGNTVLREQVTSIVDQILRTNYTSAINHQPLTETNPGASIVPH